MTTRESEIEGVRVAKGSRVLALLATATGDPIALPNPNDFEAQRRRHSHLAFGYGPHACLGARLARREGEGALFGIVTICPSHVDIVAIEWKHNPVMFGPRRIGVTVHR